MTRDLLIAGGHGAAFRADAGDTITIVDVEGKQAVDLVAFNADDLSEVLSGVETRRALRSLYIKVGDVLRSSRGRPMIEIVADSIGVHDFTIPACDASRYAVDFGCPGHRNCLDNMAEPLGAFGIDDPLAVPEPFNFFQSSPVLEGGRTAVIDPPSQAGDRVVLKLFLNAVCAVSSCPQDIIPGNGLVPSAIAVRVRAPLALGRGVAMPLLMMTPATAPSPDELDLIVPGGGALAFRASKGQMLAIADLDGGQPAGLFGVAADDMEQVLSPHHTRVFSNCFVLTLGTRLVSNRRRPMMVLGRSAPHLRHDLLMPLTEASRHGEEGGGDAVRATVARAFAVAGFMPRKLADPINLFLNVGVGLDGALTPKGVSSRAADAVAFRVVMDAVFAVAAPASDPQLWQRAEPGPIGVRVRNEVADLEPNTRGSR